MNFSFDQKKENNLTEDLNFLNSIVIIYGKKQSGKTYLIKNIYKLIENQIDEIYVFTNPTINDYKKITNSIYDDYRLIEDIINHSKTSKNIKKLIIIDDLPHMNNLLNSLIEIFHNGKNFNITLLIATSCIFSIKQSYRSQIDYVFINNDYYYSEHQKMFDYFFGMYSSLNEFINDLKKLSLYGFLVTNKLVTLKISTKKIDNFRFIETKIFDKNDSISNENKTKIALEKVNNIIESLIEIRELLDK